MKKVLLHGLTSEARELFQHCHAVDVIDSTNTWLLENKQPGTICIAKTQTGGKGTKGRSWSSEQAGNLYLSFSLNHTYQTESPPLSLIAGLACCEALKNIGLRSHGIKWPNDIYCDNKKLAGILVEVSDQLSYWVVGIGMNITNVPDASLDQTATYVNRYLAEPVSATSVATEIINSFTDGLRCADRWQERWQAWDILLGQEVIARQGDVEQIAMIEGVNAKGELIAVIDGVKTFLPSAEVSIRGFKQNNG